MRPGGEPGPGRGAGNRPKPTRRAQEAQGGREGGKLLHVWGVGTCGVNMCGNSIQLRERVSSKEYTEDLRSKQDVGWRKF